MKPLKLGLHNSLKLPVVVEGIDMFLQEKVKVFATPGKYTPI
jgi:hypothetical protein